MHTRPVRLLPAAGVPVETTEAARAAADGTAGWTVVHDVAANVALASSEPSVAGLTLAQDLCSAAGAQCHGDKQRMCDADVESDDSQAGYDELPELHADPARPYFEPVTTDPFILPMAAQAGSKRSRGIGCEAEACYYVDGGILRTPIGDVLCVHSGGIVTYVQLCSGTAAAATDVHAHSLIPFPMAGYPFLLGLQVYEARLYAHPLRPDSAGWLRVADVHCDVLMMRDLRRAREAGDDALYRRLMWGNDGRTTAEVEASTRELVRALPQWAAWRDAEAQREWDAAEAEADALEQLEYDRMADFTPYNLNTDYDDY